MTAKPKRLRGKMSVATLMGITPISEDGTLTRDQNRAEAEIEDVVRAGS